jgi:hypothetical protein
MSIYFFALQIGHQTFDRLQQTTRFAWPEASGFGIGLTLFDSALDDDAGRTGNIMPLSQYFTKMRPSRLAQQLNGRSPTLPFLTLRVLAFQNFDIPRRRPIFHDLARGGSRPERLFQI